MVIIGSKNIKELTGEVVSDKMNQSLVVAVKSVKVHPLYKKRYTRTKRYYAHDAENKAKVGDIVRIREHKPISKLKRWALVEVIESAK